MTRWYLEPAAAYVKSVMPTLAHLDPEASVEAGAAAGLRLYHYKRKNVLPRVQAAIGILLGFAPRSVLDVGSGRGTALWPMMESLPDAAFTSVEAGTEQHRRLAAIADSWPRLTAAFADATSLPADDRSFEAVTLLEVLEHIPDPESVIREAMRVASRCVVASVPSKPDDNPEHIHVLDRARLERAFRAAGCGRIAFQGVHEHLVLVAQP